MSIEVDLKQCFTPGRVAKVIETSAPVNTTVMDRFFPPAERQAVDTPFVPVKELLGAVREAPVVARGGEPVSVSADSGRMSVVIPLPVKMFDTIEPEDLNNFKAWGKVSRKDWADRKIKNLRKSVKLSCEAISAQMAFGGQINYPLLADSGDYENYNVSFDGKDILQENVSAVDKWNNEKASRTKVYNLLSRMERQIEAKGHAGQKITHAGGLAFESLINLMETDRESRMGMRLHEDGYIILGKFKIYEMSETWKNPETGKIASKLADKEIRVNTLGPAAFFYAAIDDFEANLKALPLFTRTYLDPRKGKFVVQVESKPLPLIAPESICRAIVVD